MNSVVSFPDRAADAIRRARSAAELKNGSGDGTLPPMEARLAKVESDVDHIRETLNDIKTEIREMRKDQRADFRWLIAGIVGSFFLLGTGELGLLTLMAHEFHWLP